MGVNKNSDWLPALRSAVLVLGLLVPLVANAVGMGSQSWGDGDYNEGGGSGSNSLEIFFGFVLLLVAIAWWALSVACNAARFWPFAITIGALAWLLIEGARNTYPVIGWLFVAIIGAAYYMRDGSNGGDSLVKPTSRPQKVSLKASSSSPSRPNEPTHASDRLCCTNCGARLLTKEFVLCAECRYPRDSSVAPGIAQHVAKANAAQIEKLQQVASEKKKATVSPPAAEETKPRKSVVTHCPYITKSVVGLAAPQWTGGPWRGIVVPHSAAKTAFRMTFPHLRADGLPDLLNADLDGELTAELLNALYELGCHPIFETEAATKQQAHDEMMRFLSQLP